MENQLFIIPIFLRSPEQYEQERINKEKGEIEKWGQYRFDKPFELNWPPWQYNDIIGFFQVLVNSHKLLFVHNYKTESKKISRNPNERKKYKIIISHEFTESPCYENLSKYFNNPRMGLKHRILKTLDELNNYAKEKKNYIDVYYYKNVIKSIDIEEFIRLGHPESE